MFELLGVMVCAKHKMYSCGIFGVDWLLDDYTLSRTCCFADLRRIWLENSSIERRCSESFWIYCIALAVHSKGD